jgi:hypothetical protein
MLESLYYFLKKVHLLIVFFNLTGWAIPRWRRAHLVFVGITCFCWIILGIWFGFGYCPVTDWQWQVKTRLGETRLPASFITYLLNNKFGLGINEGLVFTATGIGFLFVILVTLYVNFFHKKSRKSSPVKNLP